LQKGLLSRLLGTAFVWFIAQVLWAVMLINLEPDERLHGIFSLLFFIPPALIAALWYRRVHRAQRSEVELRENAVVTRSGYRLMPTPQGIIICLESDPSVIPAAELEFAMQTLDGTGEWTLKSQSLTHGTGAMVDVLTFKNAAGEEKELRFDVSRSQLFSGASGL
jgi:hypothetical protein